VGLPSAVGKSQVRHTTFHPIPISGSSRPCKVISRVRDFFGVEIQARSVFEAPTVEGLTAAVVRRQGQPGTAQVERIGRGSRGEEEELLSALDLLSEEEIEALLSRDSSFKGGDR